MSDQPPKTLQELGEEFHLMIGECVAAWAQVDDELFRIFLECLGAPAPQCAIIFYRLPGLDVRFNLTDEIVRSVLPPRARKQGGHDHPSVVAWTKAKQGSAKAKDRGYQHLLAVRRRIAHQPVGIQSGPYYWNVSFLDTPPPSWFEIRVGEFERLREKEAELPGLAIEDLRIHIRDVIALRDRLHRFYYDVLLKRHEESPLTDPPQSQG